MDETRAADPAAVPASAPTQSGRRLPLLGETTGLVRIGLLLFLVGVAVIAVAIIGFFLGVHNWPVWLNVCCGAFAPAGMALALIGAFAGGRRDQKAALRAVSQ
ncbi:MAG: hypothetical protein JWN61_2245 [Pseudonocardiales bacterium]|nr:hypothetical protein [Pseudonocardiales bacterium]